MTKNPVLESAFKILLDYVEDTETFATAINESVGSLALLDGQCNFLREPTPMEFMFVRAMLPANGAARLLEAFDAAAEEQMPSLLTSRSPENAEEM